MRYWLISIVVVLLSFMLWSRLWSYWNSNWAFVALNKVWPIGGVVDIFPYSVAEIEQRFVNAESFDSQNNSVQRGVALIATIYGDTVLSARAWVNAGFNENHLLIYGRTSNDLSQQLSAMRWYEVAVELMPNDPVLWAEVGKICQRQGMNTGMCEHFLAYNEGNWFVDPIYQFPSQSWKNVEATDVSYRTVPCPGLLTLMCAEVKVLSKASGGGSWFQCINLKSGEMYRFRAWVKVETNPQGYWRPVYYQGNIREVPKGFWPGDQMGEMDWILWEQTFIAPQFDRDEACFQPVRLQDVGTAWFYQAELVILESEK